MNNQVKYLNTIVNAKRNERKKEVKGFSLLDYNPFVFDAIKNAHKFMKFEENEDESGNYAQLLNQICYFSDVNQFEEEIAETQEFEVEVDDTEVKFKVVPSSKLTFEETNKQTLNQMEAETRIQPRDIA